jgi:factor associated with neutral sphingomyelinase activation
MYNICCWQARLVSNYDYLMYLNLMARWSFGDLTQWPIMPWVLNNYKTSKLDFVNSSIFRDFFKVHLVLSNVFESLHLRLCARGHKQFYNIFFS